MNFSHYKGLINGDSVSKQVSKFVFAQGNRPAVEMLGGDLEYLSETFLFKEDMDSICEEISSLVDSEEKNIFFLDGSRFSYQELKLKDTSQIVIYPKEKIESSWSDLLIPGYVEDWLQTQSGIVVFYGSDVDFVEKIRMSFSKRRSEVVKGSSMIFTSELPNEHISSEGHFLTASTDEVGFLKSSSKLRFDAYSFNSSILEVKGERLLRLADQGSLVVVNSYWSELSKAWSEIYGSFENINTRNFFFEKIIGFVGVKKAESSDAEGRVVFEALPVLNFENLINLSLEEQIKKIKNLIKKDGVSFNQSIHSLVLKRKLSLDGAYKISPDLEELNKFLSESGV